jgi:hypothetical protein
MPRAHSWQTQEKRLNEAEFVLPIIRQLSPPIVARAMAGPALGVNVQAAMRGQGIGKGPLRPDAEDLPELRIFADPDFADLDTAGA